MIKTLIALTSVVLLSACDQPPGQWNGRVKGEEYKFYPFVPGYAMQVAEEGRRCWEESNRENWDQCE
jgi:hypothetical protein|tara:strand:+ start:286 stop:486 length:201 start_codon:yes stop_codon:yes gene_type:complete